MMQRYFRKSTWKSHGSGEAFHSASFHDPSTRLPRRRATRSARRARRSGRRSRVKSQTRLPKRAMLASTRMMMLLRSTVTGAPQTQRQAASSAASSTMPARQTRRFCPFERRSKRMNSRQKQPHPARRTSAAPHIGMPVPSTARLARAMAKTTSSAQRRRIVPTTRPVDSRRASRRLRRASGKAAPIEKRKKGKTRSTQVIPGTVGSKRNSGGGTWAWNIHAGSSAFQRICPERTMPMMATPRSRSIVRARFSMSVVFFSGFRIFKHAPGTALSGPLREYARLFAEAGIYFSSLIAASMPALA